MNRFKTPEQLLFDEFSHLTPNERQVALHAIVADRLQIREMLAKFERNDWLTNVLLDEIAGILGMRGI